MIFISLLWLLTEAADFTADSLLRRSKKAQNVFSSSTNMASPHDGSAFIAYDILNCLLQFFAGLRSLQSLLMSLLCLLDKVFAAQNIREFLPLVGM